ncbi:hypothetical protein [Nonomuraea sp. NPDC001023]|uniref:hypothetical protein n=1 Tax=unclassified Nonomuraea TaxID=2593643 RepID=UPI00333219AB
MTFESSRRAPAGLAVVGEAAGELFEQDAQLQLGGVVAEAEMRTAAEAGVRVGFAADVGDVGAPTAGSGWA